MNDENNVIPNLFIIGAPKAGTSSIVEELRHHPLVFVPAQKEPRYFDAQVFFDDADDYPIDSLDEYLKLFSGDVRKSRYRVDGSVFNMYSETAIKNILTMSPSAKFVVVLRDPVSAVKSMFLQRLKYPTGPMREISDDFPVCWGSLVKRKEGLAFPKDCKSKFIFRYDLLYAYEKYLPQLIEIIPEGQLLILRYESLVDTPASFYKDIYNFLALPQSVSIVNDSVNPSQPLRKNFYWSGITFLANITRPIRKRLGITGLINIRKLVRNDKLDIGDLRIDSIDQEILKEFEQTYAYLEELGYIRDS